MTYAMLEDGRWVFKTVDLAPSQYWDYKLLFQNQIVELLMDIANTLRKLDERIPAPSFWAIADKKMRGP